jgi:hypothetical protein
MSWFKKLWCWLNFHRYSYSSQERYLKIEYIAFCAPYTLRFRKCAWCNRKQRYFIFLGWCDDGMD